MSGTSRCSPRPARSRSRSPRRRIASGLLYPPDPGSMKISTIGGNVAENSGGLRGLKYGVTRDYVMGLEVVLASGEVVWLGNKCVKDVAGYSMKDVFIGSEGTLGIITKVLLKLVPKPAAQADAARHLRADGRRGGHRLGDHRGEDHSLHAGVSRPDHDPLRRGFREDRPAARLRRRSCSWKRTGIPPSWMSRRGRWRKSRGACGAVTVQRGGERRGSRPARHARAAPPSPRSRAWRRRPSSKTPPCRAASWRR